MMTDKDMESLKSASNLHVIKAYQCYVVSHASFTMLMLLLQPVVV